MLTRPLLSTSPNTPVSVEAVFARGTSLEAWTTTSTSPAAGATGKTGST